MKKNLIFRILSTILLIKQSLGETENISTSNELTTPSEKAFYNSIIAEFAARSEEPLKFGHTLFAAICADESINRNVTSELAAFLRNFRRIETKPRGKIAAFLKFISIFCVIRAPLNDAQHERHMIPAFKAAFEKHNYKDVANEFQQIFDEFFEWLTQEYEAKSDKLTSEEQLKVKAFKELCMKFKDENEFNKKERAMDALLGNMGLNDD